MATIQRNPTTATPLQRRRVQDGVEGAAPPPGVISTLVRGRYNPANKTGVSPEGPSPWTARPSRQFFTKVSMQSFHVF
ncbi:hypothetical protein AgCh_019161 [Apium graveolens]